MNPRKGDHFLQKNMKIYWTTTSGLEDHFDTQYTFDIIKAFNDFSNELERIYKKVPQRYARALKKIQVTLFCFDFDSRTFETIYRDEIKEFEEEFRDGDTFNIFESAEETMFFIWKYDIPIYNIIDTIVSINTWER